MKIAFEAEPGEDLYIALARASLAANESGEIVSFSFNDVTHDVLPMEPEDSWRKRASERVGFSILTPAEDAERARLDLERSEKEQADAIAAVGVMTEKQMREADVPWLESEAELVAYIHSLATRPHDYGTCVYAMSMAAVAAKNYVAKVLGVTGFQAGAADMDFLRRARHMKHGFRLFDYGNLLYPQYWNDESRPVFQAALRDPDTRARFAIAAQELLAKSNGHTADEVLEHWRHLSVAAPTEAGKP